MVSPRLCNGIPRTSYVKDAHSSRMQHASFASRDAVDHRSCTLFDRSGSIAIYKTQTSSNGRKCFVKFKKVLQTLELKLFLLVSSLLYILFPSFHRDRQDAINRQDLTESSAISHRETQSFFAVVERSSRSPVMKVLAMDVFRHASLLFVAAIAKDEGERRGRQCFPQEKYSGWFVRHARLPRHVNTRPVAVSPLLSRLR